MKKDFDEIVKECIKDLKDINIPIQDDKIKSITAVDKFTKNPFPGICYGICFNYIEDEYIIEINKIFLDDKVLLKDLKSFICHELIHTCEKCMDHNAKFRKYAKLVDEAYDYGLMVRYDDYFHPELPILNKLVCPRCGFVKYYKRKKGSDNLNQINAWSNLCLPSCDMCRKVMCLEPLE